MFGVVLAGLLVVGPAAGISAADDLGCTLPVKNLPVEVDPTAVVDLAPVLDPVVTDLAGPSSCGSAIPTPSASTPHTTTSTDVPAGLDSPVGGLSGVLPVWLYRFDGVPAAGTVALRDYDGIPFAAPGVFAPAPAARYGGVPGSVPVASIDSTGTDSTGTDDYRTAGSAATLGPGGAVGAVGLPLLVAVLALSGVAAALVRTWALRRMPD